jgi:predicted SnoaL-like aldol condensation-catalyzing enzyme
VPTEEENEAIFRRYLEEVFNQGNLQVADEIFDRYVSHQPGGSTLERGPEDVKRFVGEFRSVFPDLRISIDDQIAEGDKVGARVDPRREERKEPESHRHYRSRYRNNTLECPYRCYPQDVRNHREDYLPFLVLLLHDVAPHQNERYGCESSGEHCYQPEPIPPGGLAFQRHWYAYQCCIKRHGFRRNVLEKSRLVVVRTVR